MAIKYTSSEIIYTDKHGERIHENDLVKYPDGTIKKVYRTQNDELGTDATNPAWIQSGRAVDCEFGIYPFEDVETETIELYHPL